MADRHATRGGRRDVSRHPALLLGAAVGVGTLAFGLWRSVPAPDPSGAAAAAPEVPAVPEAPVLDPDRPPNILLVTLCSVRADHLGAWGHAAAATPHLDALARDGVVFERAWSAATYTLPSHVTMFTGLLPRNAGVIGVDDTLAPSIPSLPEVLRLYGYHTIAYTPVASRASFRGGEGLERGFDTFLERRARPGEVGPVETIAAAGEPYFAIAHFKDAHPPYGISPNEPAPDPRILAWGQGRVAGTTDPDAAFLAQMDADPVLRAEVMTLYDRAITKVDTAVGSLLAGLERRGLLDHTVIVVAGDHGQALGEEGHIGHMGLLQPEVLHVPLIVRLPEAAEAGRRVSEDVGLVDLAPTLLALAGADLPARLDGRSVVPLLHGDDLPARGVLAQADVQGDYPVGGAQEVLVHGDEWLRYAVKSGVWGLRRESAGRWTDVLDGAPPAALLAERARLSGAPVAQAVERPLTDPERAALRREGYW